MRKMLFLPLLSFAVFAVTALQAQSYYGVIEEGPTVLIMSAQRVDPAAAGCAVCRSMAQSEMTADEVREDFDKTLRKGFRQAPNPQFIFSTRNGRFALGIGGFINLRASYDFKGAVSGMDFRPYDIPLTATYANRQRVMMDATTSRLFTKAVINSLSLGRVVVYVDMDFRGGEEFSYMPRLRSAYVSMLGFTAGRDVTTFCDLMACPTTVDFEGPNAYNFEFATLVRYEGKCFDDRFSYGIAAEMPVVTGTYDENFEPISQRVPDIPMYVQFAWGKGRQSHFRASAVLRNMYLHNVVNNSNTSLFGWGVQASGRVVIGEVVKLFYNGVYGKGIARYIQDLVGSGLDFTPNPENDRQIQTMPMWGVQGSVQVSIIPSVLEFTGGYSVVKVERENGFYALDQYRRGTYIFGNLFLNLSPNCRVAAEYLHGARKNMSGEKGTANRLSLMVQYNF